LVDLAIGPGPNASAGYDNNFVEEASTRKCRFAFDSIAVRYLLNPPRLMHQGYRTDWG
jgi:hypothetical protein